MKAIIRLYDAVGIGVIVCCESGVRVSNQTGGTSCLQPEVEGIFIPLRNDCRVGNAQFASAELELSRYFCGSKHRGAGATSGLDLEDAAFIDKVLGHARLDAAISVDRDQLLASHEAWVHVVIKADESSDPDLALFAGFAPYPRRGILTWFNSD